jgi:hypothetical protein
MRLTGLLVLCLASAFMQLANSKFYLIETAETKSKIVLLLLIYISLSGDGLVNSVKFHILLRLYFLRGLD